MELEKKELEQFQTYLRKKGVADNTIIAYRTAVRQFYQQASGISVGEFQAYKQYLIHHYRPSTVNTRIYGINQYILFLQRREEKIFGRKQTNQKDEQEGQKNLSHWTITRCQLYAASKSLSLIILYPRDQQSAEAPCQTLPHRPGHGLSPFLPTSLREKFSCKV